MIEIRIAPCTWRTHKAMTSSRPNTKTSTGQPGELAVVAELHRDGRAGGVGDTAHEAGVDEADEAR